MDRKNVTPQDNNSYGREFHFFEGQTARILVEFLEVAINCIVFLKGFYPAGAFERRRYMNVVVQKARHPQLDNYIHSATSELLPFIQKGLIERVAVIFYDKDHIPVERFVFKLVISQPYSSTVEENDLQFALRAFLLKLTVSKPLTKSLPPGSSWEITAYFRALPDENNDTKVQMWVPTDTKQWLQPPCIIPIKSMSSEPLKVQLYIEHPSPTELKDQNR
ncbi:DNA polymerase zeta processivity subunit isoform X2 [Phalaenopsis equestris]|uniref:DNA polymerase zeta processivity subunit isoform X2 n=1 Tax=Phalaenopsis equestris TaxID=78828 RepID=UPI0009E40186|nr:DNA polymerase zeta processivity subunit isoform X2 [Phalaenopsis equestris]